jgi:mercuric ion transport protein
MSDHVAEVPPTERPASEGGAALFTGAGIAAAFGLASCCALPMTLATMGLGSAWLGSVATLAAPYRAVLTGIAALSLLGGAVLLWRQQRAAMTCGPDGACTPGYVRFATLVGLMLGAVLLWAGYTYA